MRRSATKGESHQGAAPIAVVLAAGAGTRLAGARRDTPKPALSLLGMSLAERTLTSCLEAGIQRFLVVLGHCADRVRSHFQEIAARRRCHIEFVTAERWKLGNGASVLAAAEKVGNAPFLLTMSDHVIAPSLIRGILGTRPQPGEICLAVDRHKAGVFDPPNATKVALSDDRVVRIGKALTEWDAADTGVFLCTRALFEAIKRVIAREQYALSDGVSELIAGGQVRAVDVTGENWVDVDTPAALREARSRLLASLRKVHEDGYVSALLNRPVSTRLSARLAATGVTPNQITVVSFLLCVLGAGLLCLGQYLAGLVGGLLVQAASVLDGCDGEIARLKHLGSPRGAWLDTVLDRYADTAVALGLTYAFAAGHPGPLPWVAGFLAAFGFIMAGYVTKEFSLRFNRSYPGDILNRLRRRDLRMLLICLGAIAGRPFEALLLAGALSHFCVIGILIRGWSRHRTSNRVTTP